MVSYDNSLKPYGGEAELMVKRYECRLCRKDFRTLSGAEWHMNRFHQGDTSRLAKGDGPLSLSESILIDIAVNMGTFQRHPGLQYLAKKRAQDSLDRAIKDQMER